MVSRFSHVQFFGTPWTVARQAPLSVGFSRKEYWSGLPCPSPRDLPHPRIEPGSPALQADSLQSEPPGTLIQTIKFVAKGKKRKEKEATSVYRFKTKPRHMEAARLCWGHRVSLC